MSEIDLSSPLNYGTPSSLGSVRTPRSGIRGTPIRMRPDVRSDKRIRQVQVGGSDAVSSKLLIIVFNMSLLLYYTNFIKGPSIEVSLGNRSSYTQ